MAVNCGASAIAVDVTESDGGTVERLEAAANALGLDVIRITPWSYDAAAGRLIDSNLPRDHPVMRSPTPAEIRAMLPDVPSWVLTATEVEAWRRAAPPRHAQGFSVFLTGLSGSGKSTIARALRAALTEQTGRPVTLLDGDTVRRHLSSELGFSREHRDLNVLRIGWVASEIVRHGGIAICAPIAPYDAVRREVRRMIEPVGGFLLVHVATPLETCEARDRKGLYARARAGQIPNFTGVSDPYEPPADAALTIDTRETPVDVACALIVARLTSEGYLVNGA
jgi:sulfate adenylyltransferase